MSIIIVATYTFYRI